MYKRQSFYSYSGESENKTAKVSEAAAKEIADQFLKANKNDKFVQSKLEEQDSYLNGSSYQYHYIRQVNGLPFYDNSITVTVDAVSGKITYLGEVWNNDCLLYTSCKLKNFKVIRVRMAETSFFHTPLAGIDFTSCELRALALSQESTELKGAVVDLYQAAELAKRLGLIIK